MARTTPAGIWFMRMVFTILVALILFFHLLPLDTLPRRWAPPEFIFAIALAWSIRRPEFVPALLVCVTVLLADLLLQRPPGLWALLVMLSCEFIKSRLGYGATQGQETPFVAEWFAVSVMIVGATLLNRLILGIMAVEQAHIALIMVQMITTIVIYPLVTLLSEKLLIVRRLTASEIEALGARS